MAKIIKQNIDFKELVNITDRQLGKEIGINNNEIGEKINDKGDLATRIAGGFVNGRKTKNIRNWNINN